MFHLTISVKKKKIPYRIFFYTTFWRNFSIYKMLEEEEEEEE